MSNSLKTMLKRFPFVKSIAKTIYQIRDSRTNFSADDYWEQRYSEGGNSGAGSYNRLAQFKADFLNAFVEEHQIKTVIEFGCGDGNQLKLANYPTYMGLDVSPTAIRWCSESFSDDDTRSFYLYNSTAFTDNLGLFRAELSLSLDVLFHLVDDEIFHSYMTHLFDTGQKYVIIYSNNVERSRISHERHHHFTKWVETHRPDWELTQTIDNPYPYDPADPDNTSHADFYVYSRK